MLQSTGSIHAYMPAALDGQYLVSISRLGMTSHMDLIASIDKVR